MTTGTCSVWADPTDQEVALALRLFDEGRALLTAGKVAEACAKLEESRRLDPLPGTVLNLAVCHEKQGLAASAVAEFRSARAMAERDHRNDRVALADEHLRSLEGHVSNLVIVVAPGADLPDLTIRCDGSAVGRAAWGTRIPVDPGDHAIEATAPNKKPWSGAAKVSPDGDIQTVTVTALEDAAPHPAPVPVPPRPESPTPAQAHAPSRAVRSSEHQGLSTRRTIALVSAGVGLAGVGIGSYFGLVAFQKHGEAHGVSCTALPCDSSVIGQAASAAVASTVSFAAGLAGLALGAFLWFGDSGASNDGPAVSVLPSAGPGRGGIDLSGRF
jgi:hypothetical protein